MHAHRVLIQSLYTHQVAVLINFIYYLPPFIMYVLLIITPRHYYYYLIAYRFLRLSYHSQYVPLIVVVTPIFSFFGKQRACSLS